MLRSTTIIGLRYKGKVAIGGDGQVTLENTIVKGGANKLRRLHQGEVLAGFAGASADVFALFEKFEAKLKEYPHNLPRAAVELAKEWRTDKYLRRLEAFLAVMNKEHSLLISGSGEVMEPDDGILAIGSGGAYALAAARALIRHSNLEARQIVEEALKIAASICIYTNENFHIEEL